MTLDISGFQRRTFLKGAGAATIASSGIIAHPLLGLGQQPAAVAFDARSLLINGQRKLLISGEIHYARSTRAMWPTLLDRSKALGLNGIAVYVFWNYHEPERDVYDFTGDRDLGHFLTLCKERGLNVFLRSGPYCCAEWNFGGFPPYLRDEPGITLRTLNQPYLRRVEKYYQRLAEVVKPHLATRGGPVILVQVENEYANVARRYGDDGQKYLAWMAELAKRVGLADVPTTMCEGAAKGPIATLNGFEIKPRRVQEYRSRNDHDPMLWTELWPAWYAVWGETRLSRPVEYTRDWTTHCDHDPRTIALSVLVFLANGGAGWSYYMWHGGTNFGRTSMYLQTTSYDFTAPLDEYGRETFKGRYLSHLHEVMQANEEYLLRGERTITIEAEGKQRTAWKLNGRELVVLLDYNVPTAEMPHSRPIAAKVIDPDEKVIFDLLKLHYDLQSSWDAPAWRPLEKASLAWRAWREPMPYARRHESTQSDEPIEQLTLTRDHTDYCWYSTTAAADKAGDRELVIPYGGDYFYVYLDGKLVAQTVAPLLEDRGPITPEDPAHPRVNIHPDNPFVKDGYRHAFHLAGISEGKHRIEILATALGMIKGDWMIESPMNFERKGIWEGVLLNGSPLTGWEMTPFLAGEKKKLVEKSEAGEWSALETAEPLTWYRSTFRLSPQELAQDADFRLNTAGLGKGMLFVNGRGLGRHWLIESPGTGQPTQQYYHLPKSWLREENTLIVFEEQPVTPAKVAIERRAFV